MWFFKYRINKSSDCLFRHVTTKIRTALQGLKVCFLIVTVNVFGAQISVAQEIPPHILSSFKQYKSANAAHKFKAAEHHIKSAYEQAEAILGDHHVTGTLAHKYGMTAEQLGHNDTAKKAYQRAVALAPLATKNQGLTLLNRQNALLSNLVNQKQLEQALIVGENTMNTIGSNPKSVSQIHADLMASAMVKMAVIYHQKANNKSGLSVSGRRMSSGAYSKIISNKSAHFAKQILALNKQAYKLDAVTLYHATMLIGYNQERNRLWIDAAITFQDAMALTNSKIELEDPDYAQAFGRWVRARNQLKQYDQLEEAKKRGFKECGPFKNRTNRKTLKPLKKEPLTFPKNARISGFVIVEYDLADNGSTKNIKTIHAWPEGVYEKAAIKAMKGWEYAKKTHDNANITRENYNATLSFLLRDGKGGNTL